MAEVNSFVRVIKKTNYLKWDQIKIHGRSCFYALLPSSTSFKIV